MSALGSGTVVALVTDSTAQMVIDARNDAAQQALLRALLDDGLAASDAHAQLLAEHGLVSRHSSGFSALAPEPLDARAIAAGLGALAQIRLAGVEVRAVVASTQALAEQAGGVCLAEVQTAGRGRHGRRWQAQPGANLQCSLAMTLSPARPQALGALSLVVAVALCGALADWAEQPGQLRIKWPNDLLLAGGKLAGILPDVHWQGRSARVVCGFGVNLLAPDAVDQPVGALVSGEQGLPSRNALASSLINAVVEALEQFQHDGFAPFAERFARLDALCGQAVDWLDGRGEPGTGIARGITQDGALRVQTAAGEVALYSGEIRLQKAPQ